MNHFWDDSWWFPRRKAWPVWLRHILPSPYSQPKPVPGRKTQQSNFKNSLRMSGPQEWVIHGKSTTRQKLEQTWWYSPPLLAPTCGYLLLQVLTNLGGLLTCKKSNFSLIMVEALQDTTSSASVYANPIQPPSPTISNPITVPGASENDRSTTARGYPGGPSRLPALGRCWNEVVGGWRTTFLADDRDDRDDRDDHITMT